MSSLKYMKRKVARRRASPAKLRRSGKKKNLLFLIKSWMFVVMIALMLGIGAIVGTFIRLEMEASAPQVAGTSIEAQ